MTTQITADHADAIEVTWRTSLDREFCTLEHLILALAKWWTEYTDWDRGPSYLEFPWTSWSDEITSLVRQHLLRLKSDRTLPNNAPDFDFTPAFWAVAEELRDRIVFDLSTDDDRGVYPAGSEPYGTALTRWIESGYRWGDCGEELYYTASQPAEQYYADRAARRLEEAARSAEWYAEEVEHARSTAAGVYESVLGQSELDEAVAHAERSTGAVQQQADRIADALLSTGRRDAALRDLLERATAAARKARGALAQVLSADVYAAAQT